MTTIIILITIYMVYVTLHHLWSTFNYNPNVIDLTEFRSYINGHKIQCEVSTLIGHDEIIIKLYKSYHQPYGLMHVPPVGNLCRWEMVRTDGREPYVLVSLDMLVHGVILVENDNDVIETWHIVLTPKPDEWSIDLCKSIGWL